MSGGGGSKVEIPTYQKPVAASFSIDGTTASKTGDAWNLSRNALDTQTMNTVNQLRSELLSSLGIGSGGQDDPYVKTLMDESLRLSQPRLENSLIGRGLGGSTIYRDALTDLFSKAGTQAILNGQTYKLNNLNALQNYLQNQNTSGMNLLNLASSKDTQEQQLAQQLYQMQLPYLASINQEEGTPWGSIGSLAGAALGTLIAPGVGTMVGSQLGGMAGGMAEGGGSGSNSLLLSGGNNKSSGGLDLLSLLNMSGTTSPFKTQGTSKFKTQGTSNISNNPFALQSFSWGS